MLTEVPKPKKFVVAVLSERGANAFRYLPGANPGDRQVYFVDETRKGGITQADMLLGQFVFEFEQVPEEALRLTPGSTNRLYFGGLNNYTDGKGDKRVLEYDDLTAKEVEETRNRLTALGEKHPRAIELICHL